MGHTVEPITLDPAAPLLDIARILIFAGISSIPLKDLSICRSGCALVLGARTGALRPEYIGTVAGCITPHAGSVRELYLSMPCSPPTLTRPPMRLGTFLRRAVK